MADLDFWYEFASTYSYPAAMRVEALAQQSGATVRWRPFLLGPLFAESGWRDSPFNIYPVKGRYMWRDLERICDSLGLPFARPDPFPQSSLLVARVALAIEEGLRPAFTRTVYDAEFAKRRAIADREVVAELLSQVGADARAVLDRAESPENKVALKAVCEEAKALSLPGAPCFVTAGGEVFWGNDRLEAALEWALREKAGP
jgi:2-hydroxychromene-2-carboxylate isomerase